MVAQRQNQDLISALEAVARRTLNAAGPRYAPALDARAPNLHIVDLQVAASALTLGSDTRSRLHALADGSREAYRRYDYVVDALFRGRKVNQGALADDLSRLAASTNAREARGNLVIVRRHLRLVRKRLISEEEQVSAALEAIRDAPTTESTTEQEASRSRELAEMRLSALRYLDQSCADIARFVDGREGELVESKNSILLLGDWGTGKTHFLCDFALQALRDGTPAVVALATSLRTDLAPLDALAEYTGLAASGSELVSILAEAARTSGRRAVVLIDAINESDRDAWRRWLPKLVAEVGSLRDLGLIVSCRTPFDENLVTGRARARMVRLFHPGFEDQEFDAQLEFFTYYELPSLHVPLLASEFSRPLFLRLMCEGLRGLGRRAQKARLRDIASGQKGMTYVLENFVKRVGREVESLHGLDGRTCWLIMKGDPRSGRSGFAGVLAAARREWMAMHEAISEVRVLTGADAAEAAEIIGSMRTSGLLTEHSRYVDGAYMDVLILPYQRFADHLVARHLLDAHLDTSTEIKLKRCFYANRRLGAVFGPDRWGHGFAEPGIASALMIEFPERVRRLPDARTELLAHLPRARRLLFPFADAFLEGLYWRPTSSVGRDTETLVTLLLEAGDADIRTRTYEVLVGLAVRPEHPLGVEWLSARLRAMRMPQRDLEWSEYLRLADGQSNVYRLLAWAEHEDHSTVDREASECAIRLASLFLTTTDRRLRDRATRALVYQADGRPEVLFGLVSDLLAFGDPYISERVLAACYGTCMRTWALQGPRSAFTDALMRLGRVLVALVLRPDAAFASCHALTRGYAIGVLQILLELRPRALSAIDRRLLEAEPGQAPTLFRAVSKIRKRDVEDAERAIFMDFGNYTIGRLVESRGNYDFKHREYVGVRKQIANRMRRLGYSTEQFGAIDRGIGGYAPNRADEHEVDRYGKKYSWIAFFEMYGIRSAQAELADRRLHDPRPSEYRRRPELPGQAARMETTDPKYLRHVTRRD